MSKTKRALPEDIDITDPRDTGNYGEVDSPSDTDMSMAGLFSALSTVEQRASIGELFGYLDELRAIRERVDDLIREAERPF